MAFKPTARPKYFDFVNGVGTFSLPFTFTPAVVTPVAAAPIFTGGTQTVIAALALQHIRDNDRQNLELTVQANFATGITAAAATVALPLAVAPSVSVRYRIFRDLAAPGALPLIPGTGMLVADFTDTYSATFVLAAAAGTAATVSGTTTITATDTNAFPPAGQEEATHIYYATAEVIAVGILPGLTVAGVTVALTPGTAVTVAPVHFSGIVLDENEFEDV